MADYTGVSEPLFPPVVGRSGEKLAIAGVSQGDGTAGLVIASELIPAATQKSIPQSASNVSLASVSTSRQALTIYNNAGVFLNVSFVSPATAANASYCVAANSLLTLPVAYGGEVNGIWHSAGSGNAKVTGFPS